MTEVRIESYPLLTERLLEPQSITGRTCRGDCMRRAPGQEARRLLAIPSMRAAWMSLLAAAVACGVPPTDDADLRNVGCQDRNAASGIDAPMGADAGPRGRLLLD